MKTPPAGRDADGLAGRTENENPADRAAARTRALEQELVDRKRAEKTLRTSEANFADIFETVREGIAYTSLRGKVISVNTALEGILGIPREQIVGRNILQVAKSLLTLENFKIVGPLLVKLIQGKPVDDFQVGYKNKILEVNTAVNAQTRRLTGVIRDVTDRKRAEEELEKEFRLRTTLLDKIPGCWAMILRKGSREIIASNAAARAVGAVPGKTCYRTCAQRSESCDFCRAPFLWISGLSQRIEVEVEGKWYEGYWEHLTDDAYVHYVFDITERKRAESVLREAMERLRRTMGSVIDVTVMAVESRDPYTSGHQKRVSDLARAIAAEMGLPRHQVEGIRVAGLVHDVGKISIPAEILSMPRKLTEIEFDIIKTHPQSGWTILRTVEFEWPVAEIVYQHHERLDGSGYPRGLKGDDIGLEARIISVADVVEAMASHRPYRPSRGIDSALDEIAAGRGVAYDPSAVDACLRLFREKGYRIIEPKRI